MNTRSLEVSFGQIGARLSVRRPAPPKGRKAMWWSPPIDYSVEVEHDTGCGRFVLKVPEAIERRAEFAVLQSRPEQKLLLLMARRDAHSDIDRYLCGHDGHGWFVSAVSRMVSTVADALESLGAKRAEAERSVRFPPQILDMQSISVALTNPELARHCMRNLTIYR